MEVLFDHIIYFAGLVTSCATILAFVIKWLNRKLGEILKPMQNQIHKMDVKECRRFLIDFLVDIENGISKNEVQQKFAHDVYDHYINDLKENSYVKDFWDRVYQPKKKGDVNNA
ncbi:MAG: hypothetical protein II998_02715 [Clostridia bacterium]|nr:hypothetical protein [Clostridia bacterium]